MFNIIYSEFLKLKKSYILLLVLLGATFMPIIQSILVLFNYDKISQIPKQKLVDQYIGNLDIIYFHFFYIILFSLVSGYIFSREFTDKTKNVLYSYPSSRIKIFLSKFITIYIIILLVYILRFISSYLILYISLRILPTSEYFILNLKVNIYSSLLQLILIPIPILIANVSKNIIFPVVYGVFGALSAIFMTSGGIYIQLSPLMLPALPLYFLYGKDPIDFVLLVYNIVLTFGTSTILCIYHHNIMDIK